MTDPGPVVLNPDGPHSPEATRRAATVLSEAVRYLNHATGYHAAGALRYPSDVDAVVQEMAVMAQRLPQLLQQIGLWLLNEDAASRLEVSYGPHAGKPWQAVGEVRAYLVDASVAADRLLAALNTVRQATATIGAPDGPEEDPDA